MMTIESASGAGEHEHSHAPHRGAVLPTQRRLGAYHDVQGRGVTMAFLDSGFTRHPDLASPARLVTVEDLSRSPATLTTMPWHWHGTQTSVVAAGSGLLSNGLYRGLASAASLALVAIGDRGRIRDEDIVRGIEWVLAHREALGIRVLNLSLGGDRDESAAASAVDRAAEAAVDAGIVVVVAAGNAGCTARPVPIPPANSPSVITVGGTNDRNRIDGGLEAYCSSYGETLDGLAKPEVVAPAIWVAAPIPQGTDDYDRAVALATLESTPDAFLDDLPWTVWRDAGLPARMREDLAALRREVAAQLAQYRIVAAHYQHVDGTSFAAPIVSSIVAQMLEVNPALTPATVKDLLVATATRLPHVDLRRQGRGMVDARAAVDAARAETHALHRSTTAGGVVLPDVLTFALHADRAASVALAADFNGWRTDCHRLALDADGIWRVSVAGIAPGTYRYKYVLDDSRWVDDPSNGRRVPDGYGGFNSLVVVSSRTGA